MTFEEIVQAIQSRVEKAQDLRGSVKFVLDGTQAIHVDASQQPPVLTTEDKPADCIIRIASDTFAEILQGKASAMTAFLFGKIKVEGNTGLAMAVSRLL